MRARSKVRQGRFDPHRGKALVRGGGWIQYLALLLAIVPGITAFVVSSPVPLSVRVNAGILWALCLLPGWLYIRQRPQVRRPIPFFPIIGLFYGLYYALAPALGSHNLSDVIQLIPETDYTVPVRLALWGWVLVLTGYYGIGVFLRDRPKGKGLRLSAQKKEWWGLVLLVAGFAVEVVQSISAVPLVIAGTLNFFSSLRWFGLVLLVILAARGRISLYGKAGIAVGTFLIGIEALGSGHAAQVARVGFTIAMGVWIGRRRVSKKLLLAAVAVVLVVFTVRGVVDQFRARVWVGGAGGGLANRAEVMTELVADRVEKQGILGTIETSSETVFSRSAALDVFADVVRRTPARVPYWDGHTYYSLIGAFVPRFLWPGKPVKNVGQEFGHRYGYLHPDDHTTSFNMPVLVEFYANHGVLGVLLGSIIIGVVYRILMSVLNVNGQSDIMSAAAITLLLPLFNIESGVSITFGGLVLDGIAIWGILQAIKFLSTRFIRK